MKHAPMIVLVSCLGWIFFYVISFAALGQSVPTVESSGAEIIDWFSDNTNNARFYAWTAAFAALTLMVFGAMVTGLLPSPHKYILLGGMLMWIITGMVQAWFWAGLAWAPENLDPGTAQVLFVIPQYWGPIINGATMAFALPFILLGFGKGATIPAWLAWISVALFVEQGIETITVFGESGFLAPGGAMNLYLGGTIGMIFVIALLVWAYREWKARAGSDVAAPAPS